MRALTRNEAQPVAVGLTLVAILVFGAIVWSQLGGSGPDIPVPTSGLETDLAPQDLEAIPGQEGDAVQPAIPAGEDTGLDRTLVYARGGWTVRGIARRGARQPFPGASVRAELFEGYETEGVPRHVVELEADTEGRFAWRLDPPGGTITLRFHGTVDRARSDPVTRLVLRGQPAPDDIDVRIYPLDSRFEGRVMTSSGEPIPDATILVPRCR